MAVVHIDSIQDLFRILTLKRIITKRAEDELLSIAGDRVLKSNVDPTDEETLQFMEEEKELLRKYASYPTLTEWETMPGMRTGTKWGSTFGVVILTGELVLQHVHQQHKGFPIAVLQKMLFAILGELARPSTAFLVESFEKMISFKVERADGRNMPEDDRVIFIRRVLTQILESFVFVLDKYGVVETHEGAAQLTPMGHRVLLHLKDARVFVDELAVAHARLQAEKPNLQD